MKNNCICLFCFFVAAFYRSYAQTPVELSALKAPVSSITVDADLKDWGDSLQYYSEDAGVRYALTNDKNNLYFAIKLDNIAQAMRVLKAGITLGIDPKGKKNTAYTITFPVNNQPDTKVQPIQQNSLDGITQADRDELHRELMVNLRGIKVEGFKDIEGDMITTSNTYGIKTAIDYDAKGDLICEAAIPLKFFNADNKSKTEWSFDVKINGVGQPSSQANKNGNGVANNTAAGGRGGMGGGRSGMGGGRGGMGAGRGAQGLVANADDHSGLSKAIEFAGKFSLAPVQ